MQLHQSRLIPSASPMMIRSHPQVCGTRDLSSLRHHLMVTWSENWSKMGSKTPQKGGQKHPQKPPKKGVKNGPFLGVPRGGSRGAPGGAPGGPRGGGNFGNFEGPLGQISNHCVPTGRVIKYPRKCALFPPRGAPRGGPPGPPQKGAKNGPFLGGPKGVNLGLKYPFSGGSGRPPRTPRLRESVSFIQLAAASL